MSKLSYDDIEWCIERSRAGETLRPIALTFNMTIQGISMAMKRHGHSSKVAGRSGRPLGKLPARRPRAFAERASTYVSSIRPLTKAELMRGRA